MFDSDVNGRHAAFNGRFDPQNQIRAASCNANQDTERRRAFVALQHLTLATHARRADD
jgi:hypothetical protein